MRGLERYHKGTPKLSRCESVISDSDAVENEISSKKIYKQCNIRY